MVLRVLVTGSGGTVGSHVVNALQSRGESIEIVCFYGDLTDSANTKAFIKEAGKLDTVIHLAAKVAVDKVKKDPSNAYLVNVGGTINLLNAIAEIEHKPSLFYCSSAHVYAPQTNAVSEDSTTEPISLYGRTKLVSETIAKDVCLAYDICLCIGRVFSIHDPKQTGSYLRPSILRRLATHDFNRSFDLYGADSVRDFLTAQQAAKIIVDLAINKYAGIINIGSGQPTTIRDFAQSFSTEPLNIAHLGARDNLVADTTLLASFMEKLVD